MEYVVTNENLPEWIRNYLGIPLIIFIALGLFFTFIDFITQGWLKEKMALKNIFSFLLDI